MEIFFGRLKIEIYYGFETEYSSFNAFAVAIEEYINYYNNKRIQKKNKMDASCKIQGSIHVFRLVNNMCPGKWGTYQIDKSFSCNIIVLDYHTVICKVRPVGLYSIISTPAVFSIRLDALTSFVSL